jgi:DNA invertase Pin-like site-specific DNA recombinase
MDVNTKKAVIYCRVSTREQVEDGNSLVTQEKICREYAIKHLYEIAEVFIERGESAKTTERTELQRLLRYCTDRRNGINTVIAYKLDRISRDTDGYSEIRILLKTKGVQIKSVTEYFENTPAGKFMENIIANVAQFDNDVRTERSVTGMKEAMREGRYVWNAAFGYSNTKIAGKTNIVPNENAAMVKMLFLEVAKNCRPLDAIRKDKSFALTPRSPSIPKTTFYRMLRNEIYVGKIIKFGEVHKGTFEPIISEELFDQVQRVVRLRKNNVMDYKKDHPDFSLRRFVEHYPSGVKLTGSWSTGRQAKYAYYRFRKGNKSIPKNVLEGDFKKFLDQFTIKESDFQALAMALQENLSAKTQDLQKEHFRTQKRIDELKHKEATLIEKNYKGTLNDGVLSRQLELIEGELTREHANLYQYEEKTPDYQALLRLASEYLKNPSKIWEKAAFERKLMLQRFQFPEGVLFDGKQFGTAKIVSIYSLNLEFLNKKSRKGFFEFKKWNKPFLTSFKSDDEKTVYWQRMGTYLNELGNVLKEDKDNAIPP